MRMHGFLMLAAVLLVAADQTKPDSAADRSDQPLTDEARLQGTWKVVSMEYKGKPVAKEFFKDFRLNFDGHTLKTLKETSTEGFKVVAETPFVAAAGKGHKKLITSRPKIEGKIESIYTLEKDTLKICGPDGPLDPPKTFTTKPDNDFILIVLKRVKP